MAAEKNLENALRARVQKAGGWEAKIHGNEFQRGFPDLFVCYKGRFVALEVKAPDGHPTELQLRRIIMIRRAGGIAEVIYDMALLDEILANIDRGDVWADKALPNFKTPLKMDRPKRRVESQ